MVNALPLTFLSPTSSPLRSPVHTHRYDDPSWTRAGPPRIQVPYHSAAFASKDVVNWEVLKSKGARMLTNIKGISVAPLMQ